MQLRSPTKPSSCRSGQVLPVAFNASCDASSTAPRFSEDGAIAHIIGLDDPIANIMPANVASYTQKSWMA